jgi:hypothetical protein
MLNCFPEQKICDVPKGLKLLEEKVSGNIPPTRLSVSSSGARSRVRDTYFWKALCALESPNMFKRVSTKCALSSWGGEGFGIPYAE